MSLSKKTYRKRQGRNPKDFFNLLAVTEVPCNRQPQTASMEEKQTQASSEGLPQGYSSQSQSGPSAAFLARCKPALSQESVFSEQPTMKKALPSLQADLPSVMSESNSQSRQPSFHRDNQQESASKTSDQFFEAAPISCLTSPASEASEKLPVLSSEVSDEEKKGNEGRGVMAGSSDQEMSDTVLEGIEKEHLKPEQLLKESSGISDFGTGLLTPQISDIILVKTKAATAAIQASIVTTTGSPRQLDQKTIKTILQHLIDENEIVYPYYKQGMLDNKSEPAGRVSYVMHLFNDRNVITSPNIDLTFLRVNKTLYRIGVDLFYGSKRFKFYDPDACS